MVAERAGIAQIRQWLADVNDPEIPVLSVIDLGVVREVEWHGDQLMVAITPTYCGCPALEAMEADIRSMLTRRGVDRVTIRRQLSPPWTTDWISDDAKTRLREYGIAPPATRLIPASEIVPVAICCPCCGSKRTQLVSRFGSTPCKAIYKCLDCLEPFDAFKQH